MTEVSTYSLPEPAPLPPKYEGLATAIAWELQLTGEIAGESNAIKVLWDRLSARGPITGVKTLPASAQLRPVLVAMEEARLVNLTVADGPKGRIRGIALTADIEQVECPFDPDRVPDQTEEYSPVEEADAIAVEASEDTGELMSVNPTQMTVPEMFRYLAELASDAAEHAQKELDAWMAERAQVEKAARVLGAFNGANGVAQNSAAA